MFIFFKFLKALPSGNSLGYPGILVQDAVPEGWNIIRCFVKQVVFPCVYYRSLGDVARRSL